MRRMSTLASVTFLLILSPMVSAAEVPHEDYLEAERDEASLRYFVRWALMEINETLNDTLNREPDLASYHLENYTDMVTRVGSTLAEIPVEIDSYSILSTYTSGLVNAGKNLTSMVHGLKGVLRSVGSFENFSLMTWNYTSVRENLTSTDRAVSDYHSGLEELGIGRDNLALDLAELSSAGLDVKNQIDMNSDISQLLGNLQGKDISWDIISREVISKQILFWKEGLEDLAEGRIPGKDLTDSVSIIQLVIDDLSQQLNATLLPSNKRLREAAAGISKLSAYQTSFLSNIIKLENPEDWNLSVPMQFKLLVSSLSDVDNMESSLKVQGDLIEWFGAYDTGDIEAVHLRLSRLVQDYRERLGNVFILSRDLQRIADLVNSTMWGNVLEPDSNGDGNISLEEMGDAELGQEPFDYISEMGSILGDIMTNISILGSHWRDEIMKFLKPLESGSVQSSSFTVSHAHFIEEMTGLIPEEIDPGRMVDSYIDGIGYYLDMRRGADLVLEALLSIPEGNISVSLDWYDPLDDLLDRYGLLLREIAPELNLTGVYLRVLEKDEVPYDSVLHVSALVLDGEGNGTTFPDGIPVTFEVDASGEYLIETVSGTAEASIPIERDLSLGIHNITAYCNITSGRVNDTESFLVRRIRTKTYLESHRKRVSPGDEVIITVDIRDEFQRSVTGEIATPGGNQTISSPQGITTSFSDFGTVSFPVNYTGDDHHLGSSSEILFNVSQDPMFEVFLNRSVIPVGSMIEGYVDIELGEGVLSISFGTAVIDLGIKSESGSVPFKLNSTVLGPGNFTVYASLVTTVPRVRSGESPVVTLKILTVDEWEGLKEEEVERPNKEEKEEPVEIPQEVEPEEGEGSDEDGNDRFLWTVVISGILGSLFIVFTTVLFVFAKRRTKELEGDSFYKPRGSDKGKSEDEPVRGDPYSRRVGFEKFQGPGFPVRDPGKSEVIDIYLNMVDSSPGYVGITRYLTPREVRDRLVSKGAKEDVISRVTGGFERAVYSPDPLQEKWLDPFRRDVGWLLSWFDRLRRKSETST